jgi:O-antigen/teichoic acid export membrane protein
MPTKRVEGVGTRTGTRSRFPRAARNVLSNWATYLVGGAVSFFLSPFIVRHLGNSAYGVWVLLVSLTGYLGFLDLGIRGAVTRYVAKFHSENAHEQASFTVSSACGLFIAAGFLAILVSVLFSVFAVPHFKMPSAYYRAAQLVIVIAGANVAVSLISGVFGGVLVGLQRFELHNAIALGATALRAVSIVLALRSGMGLISLALIQLGSTIVELLLGFVYSRKLYPEVRLAIDQFRRTHVSLIFSFGVYAFLLLVSNYLIYYTDALVIGAFLPVSMVTFFAIAGNLTLYARELVGGFSRIMTPMASKLEVESDREGLSETALKAARYCSMAVLPIFVTFMIRGHSFIGLWMGPAYAELSGHVLWVLSIPWFFGAGVTVFTAVMLGITRHKPLVPIALAEGLGNLLLSIALIRTMGVVGVAWGTAIPNLAVSLFFWPWYVRRTLGIPIHRYIVSLGVVPTVAALPFGMCTYVVERFWPAPTLSFFVLQVIIVLPAALIGSWYLGLTRKERDVYSRQVVYPLIRAIGRT